MRVAIFTDSYLPHRNGVAHSISRQVSTLRSCGHQVLIVGADCFEVDIGITTKCLLKTIDSKYALLKPVNFDTKRLNDFEPDLIHIHTPFLVGALGLKYSRKYSVSVVYTHHTNFQFYYHYVPWLNNALGKYLWSFYYKYLLHSMDKVISPSKHSKDAISRIYKIKPDRICIIPTQKYITNSETTICIEKDYDIAFIGRLSSEKNISLLQNVIRRLVSTSPLIRIVIVGDGSSRNFLLDKLVHFRDKNIFYLGELDNVSTIKIISQSKFLLVTSISETQGLTIQEAWSVGVAPICVNSASIGEFVTNDVNGWIISHDVDQIALVVRNLLFKRRDMDPKLVQECYKSCHQFSPKIWFDLYKALADELKTGGEMSHG